MLGEAFLQVLKYKAEKPKHTALPKQNTRSQVVPPPETSMTLVSSRSPCTPQTLRASRHDGSNKPRMLSVPSTALAIPTCSVENHLDQEHLDSCFCPSFYQAYPDLQLAGGTVAPRYHFDPARFTPASQGPLLNSQDLGSLEDSGGPADAMVVVDEGYLVMENQKSPGREQRLTNSMLNGFLETQLMEVYRQHMQDSLARCASASVVPEICTDLSTPGTCTDGLDNVLGSSSNQSSVRYLSTCSAPPTSHFSSPVLRISYPQEPNS